MSRMLTPENRVIEKSEFLARRPSSPVELSTDARCPLAGLRLVAYGDIARLAQEKRDVVEGGELAHSPRVVELQHTYDCFFHEQHH